MNWQKFTVEEWLEQFGLWCNRCRMKGGKLPDGLHTNMLYKLMNEPKTDRCCVISDEEALEINRLLCESSNLFPVEIELLIANKVLGVSLRELEKQTQYSFKQINIVVKNMLFYLAGVLKTRV